MDAVCFLVLKQLHIIAAEGCHKDDSRYVFKALDPLAPLGSLAANIKHAVDEVLVSK